MKKKFSLRTIYLVMLVAVFAVAFAAFMVFDANSQRKQSEEALLEEARVFAREMDAVWEFMDNSQYTINTSSSGEYDFKGLHCAIVGKSVGSIFSDESDYVIRYTNYDARGRQNKPDEFERAALDAFYSNRGVWEYYGVAEYGGGERFRYLQALEVDSSCLSCHGEPAGEIDITGFAKEGWQVGDPGGAISIVIPLDKHNEMIAANLFRDAVFFLVLTMLVGFVVFGATHHFVLRPLDRMKPAFEAAGEGELRVSVDDRHAAAEISDIIRRFNSMAGELDAMYTHLEEKVVERTIDLREANAALASQRDELESMAAQLAKDAEFKSDVLSVVNHELRTPLASIITYAQLSREACPPDRESDRASWEEIERSGQVLLAMINDMLDAARFETGLVKTVLEPVDLGDVVASVRATADPIARHNRVSFEARIEHDVPLVMADLEKTRRMMENLVSNAVKFTPDDGCVVVSVGRDASTGGVLVAVSDDGIGIAPEDQVRIFEKFVQVDGTSTRRFAGSGLGLPLVREYAMAQGFTVSLTSELGQGSTFEINIPPASIVEGF